MGLRKGIRNNPAGRPKGSKNKATSNVKEWISGILDQSSRQIEKDMKDLKPMERWTIAERLLQYITPKQQSATVEATIQSEYKELERLLTEAPDEAIDRITERITRLNQLNTQGNG